MIVVEVHSRLGYSGNATFENGEWTSSDRMLQKDLARLTSLINFIDPPQYAPDRDLALVTKVLAQTGGRVVSNDWKVPPPEDRDVIY